MIGSALVTRRIIFKIVRKHWQSFAFFLRLLDKKVFSYLCIYRDGFTELIIFFLDVSTKFITKYHKRLLWHTKILFSFLSNNFIAYKRLWRTHVLLFVWYVLRFPKTLIPVFSNKLSLGSLFIRIFVRMLFEIRWWITTEQLYRFCNALKRNIFFGIAIFTPQTRKKTSVKNGEINTKMPFLTVHTTKYCVINPYPVHNAPPLKSLRCMQYLSGKEIMLQNTMYSVNRRPIRYDLSYRHKTYPV